MTAQENNPKYMYKYLQYVVEFEKYVWIWTNAMASTNKDLQILYNNRERYDAEIQASINNSRNFDYQIEQKKSRSKLFFKLFSAAVVIILICLLLIGVTYIINIPSDFLMTYKKDFMMLFALVGGYALFAALFCLNRYSANKKKISSLKKTGLIQASETIIDNKRKAAQNYRLTSADEENKIKEKQSEIFNELKKAKKSLVDIYSNNVLPVKYRNLCAAATLLGYLETGRCISIKGHGGIYDTYEHDMQMQTIITRLEEMHDSLLRIEANQQILIREMKNANKTLDNINNTVNRIDITTRKIEKNTAISAVANQQTAMAASYIAWNM